MTNKNQNDSIHSILGEILFEGIENPLEYINSGPFRDCMVTLSKEDISQIDLKEHKNIEEYMLSICKDHIKEHKVDVIKDDIFVLVHPFYPIIMGEQKILEKKEPPKNMQTEIIEYAKKLNEIFCLDKSNHSIIIFEDINFYPFQTRFLSERKKIDRCILTYSETGAMLDLSKAKIFDNKNIYLCGAYNNRCLSGIEYEIGKNSHFKSLTRIHDMILDHPNDRKDSLIPNIHYSSLSKSKKYSVKYLEEILM